MSELDIQIPSAFDPFAEANDKDSAGAKGYVHVRIQQRNGRKRLTTVQGLKKEFSYSKILKDLKKEFCCNGTVVQDPELGQVIQLQGDQRKNIFYLSSSEETSEATKLEFSEDEETLIIRMFNLVGERWALIAGRIPGRTAEEIEKYWTTRYSTSE